MTPPTVEIREATPDDAAALLDYVELVSGESDFLSFGPGEFGLTEDQEYAFLDACRQAANKIYVIAVAKGQIIGGAMCIGADRSRLAHVGMLGISVRQQWSGRGVGSGLLKAIIDWAAEGQQLTHIHLRVREDNERAIRLYERFGFEHEGRLRGSFRVGQKSYDELQMALILE